MEVYLIRHTTPGIEPGICYGQTDIDLGPNADAEIASVVASLKELLALNTIIYSDIALYTSPLRRSAKLAQALSASLTLPLLTDARLMEVCFGAWEGKPWDAIPADELTPWMENYIVARPPGGESYQDLIDRVKAFFTDFKDNNKDHTAACIITHAGAIKAAHVALAGYTPEQAMAMKFAYGSISRVWVG